MNRARSSTGAGIALLALVAFGPALLSSPGRMPADTKLYLYLDPGGLLGRATSTFEPDQFAGWVPHQQITYLWPSGPWFWLLDAIGLPDWVAHRLWIGAIMFLAGWGVHWMARRLGLQAGAALAAALVYQASPFLLPYVSRTSLLLLPWAGLGWIVGLTVGATARAAAAEPAEATARSTSRLLPWREPALIALVVATVGSPNATALALIAPAPVLWLVHAAWARLVPWRAAAAIAARTGVLCVAVSLWWAAMLVVQSRHGAPVLAYSETLRDVSRNSTGSEVLRGLGYWLFYIRDPFAPTTSAALDYLTSTRAVVVSYAVGLAGLVGLAITSSPYRRFAALLVAVGAVLSVGVHPIGSSSPLMSLLAADDGSGIALALRSSTRALPVLVLGLALGAGSLVTAAGRREPATPSSLPRRSTAVAGAIGVLAIANLPALWRFELVDPAIDRDEEPPPAWVDAAASLGADGGRILQLPGAEFGAFRWGYTVDQPLVALTDRPLVTRDLLPLGSAAAMDLLYALDDRFQEGTIEPGAVAPIARLLGADTIWVANDIEYERFRTPRPEVVDDVLTASPVAGAGAVTRFGEPTVSEPLVPMVDPAALADDRVGRPLAPVALVAIADPVDVVRVKTAELIVAGSGDGLVDAAAAGLISGHELVLYAAALDGDDLAARLAAGTPLVVTDSNRDRAHHWRGSQDVHGHTEPGGGTDDVLTPTAADQRLDVFGTDRADVQTIAIQDGPVTAVASAYGEPFAYLPERRAVHAIDGDPATAWTVGEHGDPVGERLVLELTEPAATVVVRQPAPAPGGRRIDGVRVTVDGDRSDVALGEESTGPSGQPIDLGSTAPTTVEIEITSVTSGDPATAASRAGVGFSELDFGLAPTVEWIRPPVTALTAAGDGPLAIVLTRLRTDPSDRWRSDPEPELARELDLPAPRTFAAAVTLRLDRRAGDGALRALLGSDGSGAAVVEADRRLTGAPHHRGAAAVDGDPTTAWTTPIDGALGATLTIETGEPVGPVVELTQPTGAYATITSVRVADGRSAYDLPVTPPGAAGASRLELPAPLDPGPITLTITGVDGASTIDRRFGDRTTLPAAIAELSAPGLPASAGRDDAVVERACVTDLLEIDGRPVPLSFRTTAGELLAGDPIAATVCGAPLDLEGGTHRLRSVARSGTGLTVDRVVLTDRFGRPAPPGTDAVTVTGSRDRRVVVPTCPDGCWLVDGHGVNDAWSARLDGTSLGPPTMVDGGFNGWWIPPADDPVTVEIVWTAQAPVDVGLGLSLLAVLACLAVVVITRGHPPSLAVEPAATDPLRPADRVGTALRSGAALTVASAMLVGPIWGVIALVPATAGVLLARRARGGRLAWVADRLLALVGSAAAVTVAVAVVVIVRRDRPLPVAGWTEAVDHLNGLALFAVLCIAAGALRPAPARPDGAPR